MADSEMMIASAVVVPDAADLEQQPQSPGNGLKRRRSSASDSDSKRPRLEPAVTANHDKPTDQVQSEGKDARNSRRRVGLAEERTRGKRLFGALLGTLSQSQKSAAQKKREDVERKQQAKLKAQNVEVSQRHEERLEELKRVRRREQRKVDRHSISTRHSNIRAMANFLRTRTQPSLYFRPWDLQPEQEEQIRRQQEEIEITIAREEANFETRMQQEEAEDEKNAVRNQRSHSPMAMCDGAPEASTVSPDNASSPATLQDGDREASMIGAELKVNGVMSTPSKSTGDMIVQEAEANNEERMQTPEQRDHDVVLETEEDTVLY